LQPLFRAGISSETTMNMYKADAALIWNAVPIVPAKLLWAAVTTIMLIAGLWAWTSGLPGPFQFDDHVTPLGDPASQSLAAWQQYLPVTLRPVTKLSYALEAEAGIGGDPAARRLVSILLQVITAGLLFLLIARLAPPQRPPQWPAQRPTRRPTQRPTQHHGVQLCWPPSGLFTPCMPTAFSC